MSNLGYYMSAASWWRSCSPDGYVDGDGYGGGSSVGSNSQYLAASGGKGIEVCLPTTVTNNGTIAGGGSGGGASGSTGGGAPYGLRGYNLNNFGNISAQANDGALTTGGTGLSGVGGGWGSKVGVQRQTHR